MRQLASHKVNGLNESIEITVLDQPGAGGACHEYEVSFLSPPNGPPITCSSTRISFQNGPIQERGVNGLSQEALLAIVRDRLESFQAGPYACDENRQALDSVINAMEILHARTKARMARGVEGTSQK